VSRASTRTKSANPLNTFLAQTKLTEQAARALDSIRRSPLVKTARAVDAKQRTAPSLSTFDTVAQRTAYLAIVSDALAVTDIAFLPPRVPLAAESPSSPNSPNTSPISPLIPSTNEIGLEVVTR